MTFTLTIGGGAQAQRTLVYKDILPAENPDDRMFVDLLNKVAPYTMTLNGGADALYALFQIVRYVVRNRIAGDIAECGVWRGGSMMFMAHTLRYCGDESRDLYLYDTYAGMSEPGAADIDCDGNKMKPLWDQASAKGHVMAYGGSAADVRANMLTTGYPEEKMRFVQGDVMQTIPAQAPQKIALLRLDTDWYQSTLHELTHLYERISPGGVLIIDDYGWCRGARQATDEFFAKQSFKPLMHRVDQSVRVIVKP